MTEATRFRMGADRGSWYYFDAAGWMQTGWLNQNNSWYYLSESGEMKTNGWYSDRKWKLVLFLWNRKDGG